MEINDALINAIIAEDHQQVQTLLTAGANPNMTLDRAEVRPLHFAAQTGNHDITALLLNHGADLHARTNPDGQRPFDIAKLHGHQHLFPLLQ